MMRFAIGLAGAIAVALFLAAGVRRCPAAEPLRLIAHRGGVVDEQHIENSLAAIEEAIKRGYWMIEVDIRECKDGHLVVQHDPDFRRFYDDPRKVEDMTWDEISRLRSTVGNQRPLEFHELAAACRGRIRLMLDTKGDFHERPFFEAMEKALVDNDLLATAYVIGTEQSQAWFAGKARIAADAARLKKAHNAGEPVAERYFLFVHGRDLDAAAVQAAETLGVTVVPSVNTFHYLGRNAQAEGAADIRRLRKLGVTIFQIDSVYEAACRD
ncbi:MAG: glycerophosphodiester phosphodiesterase family protein [Planctomycetia bacterium]|nr:glycerophosphodiester phosphodiesterase family protein [Planctomycetia bacterium]